MIGPMALGALGDAYIELNEPDKAVSAYLDAAYVSDNEFTTPMYLYRAGMTYEMLGEYEDAYDIYNEIYKDYFRSNEGRSIERNIARMKAMMEKQD